MNQHLLIMGSPGSSLQELTTAAIGQGYTVTTAPTGQPNYDEYLKTSHEELAIAPWRWSSTLSARTVMTAARETAAEQGRRVTKLLLLVTPPSENRGFHQIPPGELEKIIQEVLAGSLFLLREAIALMMAEGGGSCTIILDESNCEVQPPLTVGLFGGIQRTVESLFRIYSNEAVVIQGIRSAVENQQQLAGYVFDEYLDKSEKTAYRWTRYSGKAGLFGRGR